VHISNESLLVILVVGLVAGWLAGQIVRGTGFGLIGDLIVGIIGACRALVFTWAPALSSRSSMSSWRIIHMLRKTAETTMRGHASSFSLAAARWRPKPEGNERPAAAHARYLLARMSCPQTGRRAKRDWFRTTKQVAS
jgi:uncharacterized membrane protein YeaQ/YmgE (transglycosylase-associated protein family)